MIFIYIYSAYKRWTNLSPLWFHNSSQPSASNSSSIWVKPIPHKAFHLNGEIFARLAYKSWNIHWGVIAVTSDLSTAFQVPCLSIDVPHTSSRRTSVWKRIPHKTPSREKMALAQPDIASVKQRTRTRQPRSLTHHLHIASPPSLQWTAALV